MIKKTITYRFFNLTYLLKYVIAFSFLLIIVVKPLISISSLLVDTKFELLDTVEIDSSEKSENITDDENEKFYTLFNSSFHFYQRQSLSFYAEQKGFFEVKLDIYLPPPRL